MASSQLCFSAYKFRVAYVHAGGNKAAWSREDTYNKNAKPYRDHNALYYMWGPMGKGSGEVADHPEAIFKTFTESLVYAAGVFKKKF